MWYLGNYQILLILGFYMFMSEVHKIWEIVEKIKADIDRLLLISKLKKTAL